MGNKVAQPNIHEDAWVAQSGDVIGNVTLSKGASVFFQSVIRGDNDLIFIGEDTNIQDGCILHTDVGHTLRIEERVSVGHGCILHGCHIEKECLIGMGSILLNDVHVGEHCIIGAGSLVLEHTIIPANSLVVGSPAKVIKSITPEQLVDIRNNSKHYVELAKQYKKREDETIG